MPLLTVFTPAYNRAYVLPQLYQSLCRQTCRDFEWLVVDDGSTDGTADIVRGYIAERQIDIRLIVQPNGGKHRAINRGVKDAKGELFFIVDSDDFLTDDAVEWIAGSAPQVLESVGFCGLSGIRVSPDGEKIGGGNNFGTIDSNALDIRFREHVTGDLAEVFKTEVLRRFPFPEFDGEKFCPEAMVWNRIARRYKMRYCHRGIYVCKYLPDGLTAKITQIRRKSPVASMTYYSELFHTSGIPASQRVKAAMNFWRFSLAPYKRSYGMTGMLQLAAWIPGQILKLLDSIK